MANKPQEKLVFYSGYGKNFRELRKKYGLTLAQMGEKVHFSDKTINLIETEKRTPTIEQLNVYCKEFNASLDYLTGRTKNMYADISQICEVTGLSESAVNALQDLYFCCENSNYTNEESVDILNMLNKLLINPATFKLLKLIYDIKKISIYRRYHEQVIYKLKDEQDKKMAELGVTYENYNYYENYENYSTGSEDDITRAVSISAGRQLEKAIFRFIQNEVPDSHYMVDDYDTALELLYDEPQMMREYKASKLFNDIINKIKEDTDTDKKYFQENNLFILKELGQYIKESRNIYDLEIQEQKGRVINDEIKIFCENGIIETAKTVEYLKEFLEDFFNKK